MKQYTKSISIIDPLNKIQIQISKIMHFFIHFSYKGKLGKAGILTPHLCELISVCKTIVSNYG